MSATEEQINAAIYELCKKVRWTSQADPAKTKQFLTTSRRVRLFNDVPGEAQPACFQSEPGTVEAQKSNLPYRSIIEISWIIYQDVAKERDLRGSIENNLIVEAVREALKPVPSDPGFRDKRNTLEGLVHHCKIEGRIFKDAGDIDSQGMVVVPIKVLVP